MQAFYYFGGTEQLSNCYPTYDGYGTQGPDKTIAYDLGVLIPNPRKQICGGEDMIGITEKDLGSLGKKDLPDPAFTATVNGQTLRFYTYSGATYNESVSTMAVDNLKVHHFIFFSPRNMLDCVCDAIEYFQSCVSAGEELPKLINEIKSEASRAMGQLEELGAVLDNSVAARAG